jgi:hypothetical protein
MEKNININVTANTSGVKSLRQELREVTIALQQATDPKEFERLSVQAGELKDRMSDVNAEIKAMASGSKFEQISNSLGLVGESLMNLDFEEASGRAKQFAEKAKSINFKDAIGSVKAMGQTFMTVGKAVLTNPLFLIAGLVALIVIAIVKLLDKMGILKIVMKAVGDAIDVVIQAFKDLLDWMGLTDFKGEDLAKKQIARNEELIASEEKKSKKRVNLLDFEINKLSANGKDTEEIERKKLKVIQATGYKELDARLQIAKAKARLFGKDSEEYKKAIEDVEKAKEVFVKAKQDLVVFDIKEKKEDQDRQDKANQEALAKQKANNAKKLEAEKKAQEERLKLIAEENKRLNDIQFQVIALENAYEDSKLSNQVKEENAIREKYYTLLNEASVSKDDLVQLTDAQDAEIAVVHDKYALEKKAKDEAEAQARKELQLDYYAFLDTLETDEREKFINAQETKFAEDKAKLDLYKQNNIIGEQEYQDTLAEIEKKRIDALAEYDKASEKKKMQDKLNTANEYASSATGLMTTLGDLAVSTAKKDVASQEKSARQKFKIDKASALVSAGIATALAVVKSLPNIPLSILAGATGVANIAVIASKQYGGGAGSGTSGTSQNASSQSSQEQTKSTPSFNLFGSGGQSNNLNASGGVNGSTNQNITVTAVVSESQITTAQHNVANYAYSASL